MKLFTFIYMALLLVCHISCQGVVMDCEKPKVEIETRCIEELRVQNLIQQARNGDAEAYKILALCYRDGNGVERSFLNMIFMHTIYCYKTANDVRDFDELLEDGHVFKLMAELMMEITDCNPFDNKSKTKIMQLKQIAPAEAKVLEAIDDFYCEKADLSTTIQKLQEAELAGSELSIILQLVYFEGTEDNTGLEGYLLRWAEKYPFLYLKIGELYVDRYYESNKDLTCIRKSLDFYYKADAYGMLTPRCANALWCTYDKLGDKGLECDEQEKERLMRVARCG